MVKTKPYLCMGISRFLGSVGFLVCSYKIFQILNEKWELGINQLIDVSSAGIKGYGAFALSIIVGLFGLIIGQIIGASIPVKSDKLACNITIAWHYLANTIIVWSLLATTATSIILGRDIAKEFFTIAGNTYTIITVIIAAIGSQLIFLSLGISGRISLSGNLELGTSLARLLPLTIGVGMGILQFWIFGLNVFMGIAIGFFLPFILIPICAKMWQKDMLMRNPIYNNF